MGACAGKGIKNEADDDINDNYIYLPKSINKTKAFRELYVEHGNGINSEDLKSSLIRNNRESYINANYKRNSFDRFGDDFCELILSYLYLEDKMRFECLNRQWNRCIYNRVFQMDYPLERIFPWNFDEKKKLLISKKIMKKCHYVKKLKLSLIVDNEILRLVSNNHKFLERIEMRFDNLKPIRREILNTFSQNCGLRLKSIKISELSEDSFNSESGLSLLIVYSEYFSSLREIELSIDSDNCLKYFILFVDIFAERIKSLSLRLKSNNNYRQLEETFEHITRLINIKNIDLKIESENKLELNFADGVQLLSKNCIYLKNIALEIKGDIFCSENILSAFESIPNLTSLKLSIKSKAIQLGSIESLERIRNLKELYVLYANLNDDSLKNIHTYCPKLESIQLLTLKKITDSTLHSLSKIQSLIKIEISGIPYSVYDITDSGVCHIINNCRDIKIINFKCGINITQLTFSTLNALAQSSPQRQIKFSFCWKRSEKHSRSNTQLLKGQSNSVEKLWPEIKDSPQNLIIESREYFVGWCGTMMVNEIYRYRGQFFEPNDDF